MSIKRESTVPANLWSILMSSSLNVCKKYSAARHIFNSLLSVLSGDETLAHAWYITWDSYHTFTGALYELSILGVFSLYFPPSFRLFPRNIAQFRNYNNQRLNRWYRRTWCFMFSTHFSVSGLPCSRFCFAKTAPRETSQYLNIRRMTSSFMASFDYYRLLRVKIKFSIVNIPPGK